MKIGVLIPTRGDRGDLLAHAKWLLGRQTIQPHELMIVDYPPISDDYDITPRYRYGCEKLFENNCDIVLFWEDDDWYSKEYIDFMVTSWENAGKPKIFGIGYTHYYHISVNKFRKFTHPHKASACCSMVTKEILNIVFPKDNDPYLDSAMWKQLSPPPHLPNCTVSPEKIYHIGIKHGIGLSGGVKHHDQNSYDRNFIDDSDKKFLKMNIDDFSLNFYSSIK
jgi:hypothetical protein